MNNEILFRGKLLDGSDWVTGFLVIDKDDTYWIVNNHGASYTWDHVIKESVGQYTGWQDVDGTKLFSGDQIEIYWNTGSSVCHITFDQEYGYFKYGNNPLCELKDPIIQFKILGYTWEFESTIQSL